MSIFAGRRALLKQFIILVAGLIIAFGAAAAGDAPLTEDQAKRFVNTLPALEALREKMETEGKAQSLEIASKPRSGEPFKPYTHAVAALKQRYPVDHARLTGAVKQQGFTAAQWAQTGDQVMIAYLALRMQEDDPRTIEMMEGMDASMMSMMPPEMRSRLEGAFALMEVVKNAPESDKKAVASVKNDLDAYLEREEISD